MVPFLGSGDRTSTDLSCAGGVGHDALMTYIFTSYNFRNTFNCIFYIPNYCPCANPHVSTCLSIKSMATGGEPAREPDPRAPWDQSSMGVYFTVASQRYSTFAQELIPDESIGILSAGEKFLYVLPGFDILGIELRHIKVKGFGLIGAEEENFDLFIKNDASLCRSYPAAIVVKDITVVKVSNRQH